MVKSRVWEKSSGVVISLLLLSGLSVSSYAVCKAESDTDKAIISSPSAEKPADMTAINRMNDEFRAIYANARHQQREENNPVIVANGDKVILLRNGERFEYTFVPQDWSVLKSVDHIPLAAFVLLNRQVDTQLPTATLVEIQKFRTLVEGAKASVLAATFPQTVGERNAQVIDQTLSFLDSVHRQGRVSRDDLESFARHMAVPAIANADDAEKIELSRLDDQVQAWRHMLTPAEWKRLRVVIIGGHMPRQEERRFQYFADLLGESREGDRIIFQEGSDDENKALDLLATHVLDSQIGVAFFNDPWRMHRDLLSDSARRYLKKHHPATE